MTSSERCRCGHEHRTGNSFAAQVTDVQTYLAVPDIGLQRTGRKSHVAAQGAEDHSAAGGPVHGGCGGHRGGDPVPVSDSGEFKRPDTRP